MHVEGGKPKDNKTYNFWGGPRETNPIYIWGYIAEGERNPYSFGVAILNETKSMYHCVREIEVNTLALHSLQTIQMFLEVQSRGKT